MEMSNKRGAFSISRVWLLALAGWFWFQTVCGSGSTSESESEIESGSKTAPLRSAQLWKVGGGWLGGWVAWGWRNLRPTNAPCELRVGRFLVALPYLQLLVHCKLHFLSLNFTKIRLQKLISSSSSS